MDAPLQHVAHAVVVHPQDAGVHEVHQLGERPVKFSLAFNINSSFTTGILLVH